jgi:hypothetical protein
MAWRAGRSNSFRCAQAVGITQTMLAKAMNALIVSLICWLAVKPLSIILASHLLLVAG